MPTYLHRLLFTAVFALTVYIVFSQTAEARFGQNRVQYKDFDFQYYKTDHFTTYFYPGGQEIGKYVAKTLEDFSVEIGNFLDVKYKKRIDVIVYNTINDLNQTNIGYGYPDQNQGGNFKVPGDKIFVYFNGSHQHIDEQLKEALTRIYLDKLMGGGSLSQRIGNSLFLNLSDWFKKGFIQYSTKNWGVDEENKLRDGMLSGKYRELSKLSAEEQVFIGHAIWYYVAVKYGKNTLPNILYLTRANRSIEEGFQFALGISLDELVENWYKSNAIKFNAELKNGYSPNKNYIIPYKKKREHTYYQFKADPSGKKIAYVSNDYSLMKVYILDIATKKQKLVLRTGFRTNTLWTDQSTPLLAWTPKGDKLSVIFDKADKVQLLHIDANTYKKEKLTMPKFQKVTSFAYTADANHIVISALQNGQSDIFLYKIPSQTVTRITDDYFDDFEPAYIKNDAMEGVIFSSNRNKETLEKEKYESQLFPKQTDLYFYDLQSGEKILYRLTNTPLLNEKAPQLFNSEYYSYLGDENGITNMYIGKLNTVFSHNQKQFNYLLKEYNEEDSVIVSEDFVFDSLENASELQLLRTTVVPIYKTIGVNHQLTNFTSSILTQQFLPKNNNSIYTFYERGFPRIYKYEMDTTTPTVFTQYEKTDLAKRIDKKDSTLQSVTAKRDSLEMIVFTTADEKRNTGNDTVQGFDFQSEFDFIVFNEEELQTLKNRTTATSENSNGYQFKFSKVRPYFVRFMVDKTVAQLNNDLLVTRYQPYNPNNPNYTYQPLNALFKIGITDILEDYKLYGGITLPLAGNSAIKITDLGYFLSYENLRKRWDKKITVFYQALSNLAIGKVPFSDETIPAGYLNYRQKTTYIEASFRYPFNVLNAVNLTGAYRNDTYVYKSEDKFSLNLPNTNINWVYLRAEYIYDNTFHVMDNIRYGTRLRVYGEFHKEIPTKLYKAGEATFRLPDFNKYFFTEIGVDARHYQKLYKQMILALRFSAATSLGNRRMIHYMGGIDNNLVSIKTAGTTTGAYINPSTNYAYQTIAAPMRGFGQNARNGTSFALINAEIRAPIFTMLMRRPSKSEFIRNFMLVAFTDIGTAWEGLSPFSSNNPLFIEEYKNNNSVVRILKYKNPVVMGVGGGLRTSIFNYFIKFDAAWGYDTGEFAKKPLLYFSFGYDF